MRWLSGLLALLGAILLLAPGAAAATPFDDAARSLQNSAVYLQSGATNGYGKTVTVDSAAVSDAFGTTIKVAIFAEGTTVGAAVPAVSATLPGQDVLVVFVGSKFAVTNNCGNQLPVIRKQVDAHLSELRAGDYTATLVAFGREATRCSATADSGTRSGAGSAGDSSAHTGRTVALVIGVILLVAIVVIAGYVWSRRRRTRQQLADARAAVTPYYDRLASEVGSLHPGDNATARQALADASERFTSAGSQMASANSAASWAAVRRTVLEGLQASQTARRALGIDPGPALPPIDEPRGEQLDRERTVQVQGNEYRGYPEYTPGAPYYYAGGGGYLGGWYTFPFWETMLIGSMIGGGWGDGGYGAGYDTGYSSGYDAAQDSADVSGDGGGDGAGTDFSGGDFSGGGDFGGGDFSGGDFSGGDFGGGGSDSGGF